MREHNSSTPWTIHFDRDGTEDIAIIRDAEGNDLVTSDHFWLRERHEPVPPVLAAVQLMAAAPKLLAACQMVVERREQGEPDRYSQATRACREAVAEATNGPVRKSRKPIVIEVRGGVVQEVRNVPHGIRYEIIDHDDLLDQKTFGKATSPLPPDPEGMNDKRAAWAGTAIKAFQKATGADDVDALCDLLADLMHWADRKNYQFEFALLRANAHYEAETLPEDAESGEPSKA